MAAGKLQVIGSSPHLKHRFGSGYQLDINMPPDQMNNLCFYLGNEIRGSSILSIDGPNIKIRLPKGVLSLGEIFGRLEVHKKTYGIKEYSLSETTLEQIFLQIAAANEPGSKANNFQAQAYSGAVENQPNQAAAAAVVPVAAQATTPGVVENQSAQAAGSAVVLPNQVVTPVKTPTDQAPIELQAVVTEKTPE